MAAFGTWEIQTEESPIGTSSQSNNSASHGTVGFRLRAKARTDLHPRVSIHHPTHDFPVAKPSDRKSQSLFRIAIAQRSHSSSEKTRPENAGSFLSDIAWVAFFAGFRQPMPVRQIGLRYSTRVQPGFFR